MTVKKENAIIRFIGASTDTKPTGATVPIGSTFYEYDTKELYITYDNTNWVKKKVAPFNDIKVVRSVKTLDASAIYHAFDVLSEDSSSGVGTVWRFNSVVDGNGGSGVITHAQCMTETSSASGDISLYLFNATPTCTLADHAANTAPVYSDVTASIYIGKIDFPNLAAVGTTGEATAVVTPYTASGGLPLPFVCESTTNAIFGVAIAESALGVVASTDMMFALTIEKR